MANTIIGKVLVIGRTEEIPSKNGGQPFLKRTLVQDCSRYDQYTGKKFENYPQLEFASKNTAILDNFNVGDVVEVSFALQGRSYEKDGVHKYFTSIVGYKVEPSTPNRVSNLLHKRLKMPHKRSKAIRLSLHLQLMQMATQWIIMTICRSKLWLCSTLTIHTSVIGSRST